MAVQDSALKSFVIVEKNEIDDILNYEHEKTKLNNLHENMFNHELDSNVDRVIYPSHYDGVLNTYDPSSQTKISISKNIYSTQMIERSLNSTDVNCINAKDDNKLNNLNNNSGKNLNNADIQRKNNSDTLINGDSLQPNNSSCDDLRGFNTEVFKLNSEDNTDIYNINNKITENAKITSPNTFCNKIIDNSIIEKNINKMELASKNELNEKTSRTNLTSELKNMNTENVKSIDSYCLSESGQKVENKNTSNIASTLPTHISPTSTQNLIIENTSTNTSILNITTTDKVPINKHNEDTLHMQNEKEVKSELGDIINNIQTLYITDIAEKKEQIGDNKKDNNDKKNKNSVDNDVNNINNTNVKSNNKNNAHINKKNVNKNNIENSNRRVTFPEGEDIVSGYMDAPIPWRDASVCTTEHMLNAYLRACKKNSIKPLASLMNQLKAIGNFVERNETLTLRNESLDTRHCECLEEVLSRVQFRTIDLENTHLDDEGSIIMFDMIEYYESCLRMNIYMNASIDTRGWQACSHLIRKSSSLEQVDLGCTNISEHMLPFMVRAFKTAPCLTILRLENAMMAGRPLATLVLALKVNNTLRQLYLGNNKLNPLDCIQLHSLLNFNRSLRLLDLRNNNCQDAGVEQLSSGLLEQSREMGGLETLVLWNNMITYQSMPYLARALMETKALLGLNLGMNQGLTNEGVHFLKDSLVRNRSLLKIGLQSCRLTCEGAVAIAEYIAETVTLLRVDLRGNDIRTGGMMALTLSLKVNQSVLQLDLDKNPKKENKLKDFLSQQKQLLVDITNYVNRNNRIHTQLALKRRIEEEEKKVKEKEDREKCERVKEEENKETELTVEEGMKKVDGDIKEDSINDGTDVEKVKDKEIKDQEQNLNETNKDQHLQRQQQPSDQQLQQDHVESVVAKNDNDDNTLAQKLKHILEEDSTSHENKKVENNNNENNNIKIPSSNLSQQQQLRTKLSLDLYSEQTPMLALLNSASSPPTPSSLITPSTPSHPHDIYPETFHPSKPPQELFSKSTSHNIHPVPPSPMVMSDGVATLRSISANNLVTSPSDQLGKIDDDGFASGGSGDASGGSEGASFGVSGSESGLFTSKNTNIINDNQKMDFCCNATNKEMDRGDVKDRMHLRKDHLKHDAVDSSLSCQDPINQNEDLLNDIMDNEVSRNASDSSIEGGSSSSWRSVSSGSGSSSSSINNEPFSNIGVSFGGDKAGNGGNFSGSGEKGVIEKLKSSASKQVNSAKKVRKAKKKRFVVTPTSIYHRHPLHSHVNNKNNIGNNNNVNNKVSANIDNAATNNNVNKASSNIDSANNATKTTSTTTTTNSDSGDIKDSNTEGI